MPLADQIPAAWRTLLAAEFEKPYWPALEAFVAEERATQTIYPPAAKTFSALELTPPDQVKAFLLGQDPYHGPGQAHGLCFSVLPGVPLPPSLINIYKELRADTGIAPPRHGYLAAWAEQGLLMLNAVLTVREAQPNSHKGKGWERFTDAVITVVSAQAQPTVFLLWGAYAQKKLSLIDNTRHRVIASAHPSPLSARSGFFGSRPFSQTNALLRTMGREPIVWELPKTAD